MTLSLFIYLFFLAFPSKGKGPRPTENGSATHQLRTTALMPLHVGFRECIHKEHADRAVRVKEEGLQCTLTVLRASQCSPRGFRSTTGDKSPHAQILTMSSTLFLGDQEAFTEVVSRY